MNQTKTKQSIKAMALTLLAIAATATTATAYNNKLKLWYNKPASYWEQALPLGNGRLGAMVSGSVAQDTIQLNEDTFWSGSPYNNVNKNCLTHLKEMRDDLQKGTAEGYTEAQKLAMKNIVADRSKTSHGQIYESVGRLLLTFPGQTAEGEIAKSGNTANPKTVSNYQRWLNLANATSGVEYTLNGVKYNRTVFTSFADQVTVIHLTASQAKKLKFALSFVGPEKTQRILATSSLYDKNTLMIRSYGGKAEEEHIPCQLECYTFIRVIQNDGHIKSGKQAVKTSVNATAEKVPTLEIDKASDVTILVSCATNFVNYHDISADAKSKALAQIEAWQTKQQTFDKALAEHTAKYEAQFDRVSLDLGDNPGQSNKDTETRIREFADAHDPSLAAMYFQFGRYLLISSSQPGTQPANLQGIWNPDGRQYPAWDSKYTTNINVEMNYWPAEVTNLSECHQPFLNLIKEVSETGKQSASEMYGCRG